MASRKVVKPKYMIAAKDMQPGDKPLDRLVNKGVGSLSNPELLAILLWTDFDWKGHKDTSINVAHRVFRKYNIKKLSQASVGELEKIFGIGKVRAGQIQAVFELGRRLASHTDGERAVIETPEDVFRILGPEMQGLEQECFKVVLLDNRNRMIKHETVTLGILNSSLVHSRELFRSAIDNNAASIILVHNHPSGDANPSDGDIELTRRIFEVGNIIGIEVKDHIIIGNNSFISFKEKNLIDGN